MAQVRVPYLLGHAEVASLFHVERQTSQKWRADGTLAEPDLVASGNPYWLLETVLRLEAGERHIDQERLTSYTARIPRGLEIRDKRQLPIVLGIQEAGRVLGRDAQTISRWRHRSQFVAADLVLSGSPLWLLQTILDDAVQRERTVVAAEVSLLNAGHRTPQKPRGRGSSRALRQTRLAPAPPGVRTFTATEQAAAVEFLAAVLAEGYSVTIKPQP
ncbi:hypothetical protein [Streptomyces rubiginosohelvolus]|uniref:hypothetical protein n=1 Tax=Streptomyces rubiginosohelvolus TaxID=67362 RepID=UPI003696543E